MIICEINRLSSILEKILIVLQSDDSISAQTKSKLYDLYMGI